MLLEFLNSFFAHFSRVHFDSSSQHYYVYFLFTIVVLNVTKRLSFRTINIVFGKTALIISIYAKKMPIFALFTQVLFVVNQIFIIPDDDRNLFTEVLRKISVNICWVWVIAEHKNRILVQI